jgi:hypothetical protein
VSQSSVLVATLAAGFLLFIAARGRLPVYTSVLWGSTAGGGTGGKEGEKKGGIDMNDALDFGGSMLPPPFNMLYQFGDIFI